MHDYRGFLHLLSWRPTGFRRTPQEHPPIQGLHASPLLVSPNSSPSPGAPSPPSSLSPHPSPTNNIAPPMKSRTAGRVQSSMSSTAGSHSNQHTTLHLSHLRRTQGIRHSNCLPHPLRRGANICHKSSSKRTLSAVVRITCRQCFSSHC